YPLWPGHAIKGGMVVLLTIGLIIFLAYWWRVPVDFNYVQPDDGMYIPGPEWYMLFFLQPFWYLKGGLSSWRFIGTFVIPVVVFILLLAVPFLFNGKPDIERRGLISRILLALPALAISSLVGLGIFFSGSPAKLYGCIACHNPTAGVRHALPPMDVMDYYKGAREMQIKVGRYRASKIGAGGGQMQKQEVETYKDANWNLRHIYEPTFTW
ncbi:MAG: hypothetical protein HY878_04650, partial [Deltaproteobacteria bacterium]|nr:hypothetical protein [Deltaproteobacteria bacterium]